MCSVTILTLAVAVGKPATESSPTDGEFNFIVQTWRTSEGLPANVILHIAQTPDGYLWLATTHGLVRFDGVRFESYLTTRTPHRFGTRIEGLDVDSGGRLWIVAEQRGVLAHHRGRFLEFHTNAPALTHPTASLRNDPEGGVWVLDARGNLARLPAPTPGEIESVDFTLGTDAQLLRDGAGGIWAVSPRTVSGVITGRWANVLQPAAEIMAAGAARNGGLWLALDGRLQRLGADRRLEAFEAFPWPAGATRVTCGFEDHQGAVWIGTSSRGLFRRANGVISQVMATPRAINCLAEDAEGNLWVGTRGGGVAQVRRRVFHVVDSRVGLDNEYINTVAEDGAGRVWLATEENGLGWFAGGRWHPVSRDQGWPGHNVLCLAPTAAGDLWLATPGQGVWRAENNRLVRARVNPALPTATPRCAHVSRDGTLWLVMDDLAVFSVVEERAQRHGYRNGLGSVRIRAIAEDADGGIWVGSWHGGLWRYSGSRWEEMRPEQANTEAVRAMVFDARGNLWMATAGAGLLRFRERQTARIAVPQGLPGEEIEQVLLDGDTLWFATGRGLFHASIEQLNAVAEGLRAQVEVLRHGQNEGLPDLHFTGRMQPRSWRTQSGQLWFATANGAVCFHPAELPANEPPPRAILESVLINGRPRDRDLPAALRSDARRLEFRFTAPNFSAPERVRFRYQLSGVDETWVECGAERSATYASLPFGTHSFRVEACSAAGEWGPTAESAPLVVQPFFWQTQWFIALVAASVAGGLVWAARRATLLRLRRRLKRLEQEHALERERARISQDIHDELGANLTTIGLLADMGGRHQADPPALRRDLTQISEVARGTASAMDAIVWALNPRNDTLDHFANYIGQFTKDFFRPTAIRTRLDFPATLPEQPMSANTRHNLFLAVKEALNNVVRHAKATEVRLSLHTRDGTLRLSIEDNGKGLPGTPVAEGQDGLAGMRDRVESLGGTLAIEPARDGGTRLAFAVPLAKLNAN